MTARFKPFILNGQLNAPPSKSMAHRYLIGSALCKKKCVFKGIDYSEDILATIDCLKSLGVKIVTNSDSIEVDSKKFMTVEKAELFCRESGSTLRFLIPLALCLNKSVTFYGSERLISRPLGVYEELCKDKGFTFKKDKNSVTVCGTLESGNYKIRGDISSQFISGLIFAFVYLNKPSVIEVIPPFESKSYTDLTVLALRSFGADVTFKDKNTIIINPSQLKPFCCRIEGDYSNAAFIEAFNHIGSKIEIGNLNADSLQGDRIYKDYFKKIDNGTPTLDISNCPDLAPVLIALASLKNGAHLMGTDRLKIKESDRGQAMHEELCKLGGGLIFGDNEIIVPKQNLKNNGIIIDGHNDHRIVMGMSLILSVTGGELQGTEAVKKSYPQYFDNIKSLGAKVELI